MRDDAGADESDEVGKGWTMRWEGKVGKGSRVRRDGGGSEMDGGLGGSSFSVTAHRAWRLLLSSLGTFKGHTVLAWVLSNIHTVPQVA